MAEYKMLNSKECPVHTAKKKLDDENFFHIFHCTKEEMPNCDYRARNSKEYKDEEIDKRTNPAWRERQRISFPTANVVTHSTGDNAVATCYNHRGLFDDSQKKMEIISVDSIRPYFRRGEPLELMYRRNKRQNLLNDKKNKIWDDIIKTRSRFKFRNHGEGLSAEPDEQDFSTGGDDLVNAVVQKIKDNEEAPTNVPGIDDLSNLYE